jgi:SAM-dependent methyltransferase
LLYAGSAPYYSVGRAAYPAELAAVIADELALDGTGTLVDVGCGPGPLTLLLAPRFRRAIGVDPDPDMLAEAARLAAERGVTNVEWRKLRAEDLPAGLAGITAVTFAQSFHWMDRERVAAAARSLLAPAGALIQVHATTHRGTDAQPHLPHPQPPWDAITVLVQRYLGPHRRAGSRVLPEGTPDREDLVFSAAGFTGPHRIEVPAWRIDRGEAEIAASVYSLSSSAPHLFGDRLASFDSDLRELLATSSDQGMFSEQMRGIAVDFWR